MPCPFFRVQVAIQVALLKHEQKEELEDLKAKYSRIW